MSRRRVTAMVRKELREYRRNRYLIITMAIIPLIFLVEPLVSILNLPAAASVPLSRQHELLYMLAIPVLVPSMIAAASVVTERQQGTLEPVLTTPIRREELILAKALAPLGPAVVISYLVYGVFVVVIVVFARAGVAPALLQGSVVAAQVVFTPLLASWSIWVGIAISTRMSDVRAAQQLSVLASLPLIAVTTLIAFGVIKPTLPVAVAFGAGLIAANRLGWRLVSALFDRERLIAGVR